MEYLKQIQTRLSNNDLPAVVNLWHEYCMGDEIDSEEFKQILLAIKESPLASSFGNYIEEGLSLWETLPESETKHAIICLIYDIQSSNSKDLADRALRYLESRYAQDEHFQQKIRLIGLREKESFKGALTNYDLLTHMQKGYFFIHTGGWGVGQVTDVSMLREQITLEFDYVSGLKEISFTNAFKTLIPISKDHFLARRFGDAEAFEVYAKEFPVETIRLLLRDLGPKTALEIKDELEDLVIPTAAWARWWQTTRTKIKKDTFIYSPETPKEAFRLRIAEVSHEDRLQKALANKPETNELIELVYSFLRDFPIILKNTTFKESLKQELIETLAQKELTDAQEIQILFILQDLEHEKAKNLQEIIVKLPHVDTIVTDVHVLAYKKRILTEVHKARSDWKEIFADLLFTIDQNPLRDYLLAELLSNNGRNLVEGKIDDLLNFPHKAPATFLWYFQRIMTDKEALPFNDQEGKNRLFEAFFTLMHYLESHHELKDLVKKMHACLLNGRFAAIRNLFQGASIEVVKEILLLSTKCQSLSDHDIKILYSLAEVVHPSLAKLRGDKGQDEDDLVIWTTSEGYHKVKNRIEEIATVDMIENAKEVEIARAHGDLRENSEYKFAVEKRSRLQGEIRLLSDQLRHMRVLAREDIDTSKVGVGSVITLEGPDKERVTYTILGPSDTDPDKNILSFQSKLAQSLLNLTPGSTCTLHNQPYTLLTIASYL